MPKLLIKSEGGAKVPHELAEELGAVRTMQFASMIHPSQAGMLNYNVSEIFTA